MTTKQVLRRIHIKIKDLIYFLGLSQKKETLIYLGLNHGIGFGSIFRNYKVCYGFEADPELSQKLKKKFKKYKGVHIINAAVAKENGEIEFNISNNNGLSSSIGTLKKDWKLNDQIEIEKTIIVPSINLCDFLQKRNIKLIDNYVSDIQGFDLEVLKTLRSLIKEKSITTITSEVAKDEYKNIYDNIPDNNFSGFSDLLKENYDLVAKGEGILKEGVFNEVPDSWWEMDCMWKVKP